ncbi:MAG: hypothetical protein ACOX60_09775 [Massiliimalia sp.]|jgi:hypothetical protein
MKKALLIPAMIFPYLVVLFFICYFIFGNLSDQFSQIFLKQMEWVGVGILLMLAGAVLCNIIFMVSSRTADSAEILKAALLLKCIHIPTYLVLFLFGLILGMMFFITMPLILFLVFLDYITLVLSSMVSVYALARSLRDKTLGTGLFLLGLICQFLFCLDVISLLIFVLQTKNVQKIKLNR